MVGRHPADIEDITRMVHFSSYWRGGPVLNNALSGVDQALWDIAGKRAGMPVYELLGGRVARPRSPIYLHASGATIERHDGRMPRALRRPGLPARPAADRAGRVSAPTARRGIAGGVPGRRRTRTAGTCEQYLRGDPGAVRGGPRRAAATRSTLLHDVHSRLTPKQAVVLARALEPYRLFFLEDVIAPEHYDRLPEVRAASPVPIAVGEQVGSVADAARLVRDGGVDFLRLHISAIGGLTPARKLAGAGRADRRAHRVALPGRRLAGRARPRTSRST